MRHKSSLWTQYVMRSPQQRLAILCGCILAAFLMSEIHWRSPLSKERTTQRHQLNTFLLQVQDESLLAQPLSVSQAPLPIPRHPIVIETWHLEADQGQLQLLGAAEHIFVWLHALQATPWMFSSFLLEESTEGLRLTGSMQRRQQQLGSAPAVVPPQWQQPALPINPISALPSSKSAPLISCAPNFSWEHEVIAFTPEAYPTKARIATRAHPALMPISYYLPSLSSTPDVQVEVSITGKFRLFAPDRDCIPVEFPLLPAQSSPVFWLP